MSHIAVGIAIGLVASGLQSLGLTIQRRSHVEDQRLPQHEQRSEYRRPLFLLGFAIFIISNLVGSILQILMLPIIILAPLGAISLLWNALFARLILGDFFSPWLILGTLGIIAGALLIAIFGIIPKPTHSLEDLLRLFNRPAFITYFSLLGAAVIVCLAITHITEFAVSRRIGDTKPLAQAHTAMREPSVVTTGIRDHLAEDITATETSPLLPRRRHADDASSHISSLSSASTKAYSPSVERTRIVLAFSYASFSGIISGMCLLFAKSGVELLLLTVKGDNQFWRWQAWMLLFGLVSFALLQLWYLHKALILANPTFVCPSAFCFYNLSSIINGLVYYNQFSLIPPLHLGLVSIGIVILLGGVWLISLQSGDGAVDIAPWNADQESITSCGSEISSIVDLVGTAEAGKSPVPNQPDATHSDTNLPSSLLHPGQVDMVDRGPRADFIQTSIPSMPYSPERTSPQRYGQATFVDAQEASTSRKPRLPHHGRSTSYHHPHHHAHHLAPPLGDLASTFAAGGLQIGLSPISPGFSLVLKRQRRVSAGHRAISLSRSDTLPPLQRMHSGDHYRSTVYSELGRGHPSPRDTPRRRTVSEGDVGRMANIPSLATAAEDLRRLNIPSAPSPGHDSDAVITPWRWFRRFLRRS